MQYESPIISGKKIMAKIRVFQKKVKLQVKVMRSKITVYIFTCERSCHKQYISAI